MGVVLYTTGCPRCHVLEKKLEAAGVDYAKVEDVDAMIEKGYLSAPILEVDGKDLPFKEAVGWVARKEKENAD